MRVDEFDFELPEELIALRPARPRDASRLLHVGATLQDCQFAELPSLLREGDVLVLNDTSVLPAALKGQRPARDEGGGGAVDLDINLHKALPSASDGAPRWAAFARPAKRLREGDEITFAAGLLAIVESRLEAEVVLRFNPGGAAFSEALSAAGQMPLPPYIGRKRELDEQDLTDYQTIFASREGSVAAPTAGLHFTPEIFAALEARGVRFEKLTLHVGAGTFLPVSAEDTGDHRMHAEYGEISAAAAERLNGVRAAGGRIVATGTTSLRLLESAADESGKIHPFADETDIFITPGYQFRAVDVLITNFHLPRSTLFMLVSAFAGFDKMKAAYAHAIKARYRFYSYGDACYLERHDQL